MFLISIGLTAWLTWRPLAALLDAAFEHEQNSHILLVFPVVIGLLFLESRGKTVTPKYAIGSGCAILAVVLLVAAAGMHYASVLGPGNALSLSIAALVVTWLGLIVAFYGWQVFRQFVFPFLFLLLLIPFPPALLDLVTRGLQYGSTRATQALFVLFGIPVAREGFVLFLPSIDIEVASECSGIRSSMMLFLTTLVLGYLFLRTSWRQAVLFLSVIVITILKNGLRIFTLSTLAMYVDQSWIEGEFHHRYGGSVFFALAIGLILIVLRGLRRSEQKLERRTEGAPVSASANSVRPRV
jgi:exosortase